MADERNLIPRPSAWADRTGPSGWKDTSPIFGPQKAVPPAQSNALGFRPRHDSTLKGSFGLGEHHAAIVGQGVHPRDFLDQESRPSFSGRVARRTVRRPWRHREQPRLSIVDRRRGGRPRSYVVSIGAYHRDCRRCRQDQIDIVGMGESNAGIASAVSLAGRVRGVFGESIECGRRAGIHSQTTGASREAIVPGRVARMVAAVRYRMGRTVCVGLEGRVRSGERPFQGRGVDTFPIPRPSAFVPRVAPWADRTGPSGRNTPCLSHLVFEPERLLLPASGRKCSRFFEPERLVLPAQGQALGSRPPQQSTLKGSFISPAPKAKRATGRKKKGGGE